LFTGYDDLSLTTQPARVETMTNIITNELNGKKIAYHSDTQFQIQVGRGKSSYKTKYIITGSLAKAVMYFHGINIGNGYKKRLVAWTLNNPVLARQFS
jgi:hypothetical protein